MGCLALYKIFVEIQVLIFLVWLVEYNNVVVLSIQNIQIFFLLKQLLAFAIKPQFDWNDILPLFPTPRPFSIRVSNDGSIVNIAH